MPVDGPGSVTIPKWRAPLISLIAGKNTQADLNEMAHAFKDKEKVKADFAREGDLPGLLAPIALFIMTRSIPELIGGILTVWGGSQYLYSLIPKKIKKWGGIIAGALGIGAAGVGFFSEAKQKEGDDDSIIPKWRAPLALVLDSLSKGYDATQAKLNNILEEINPEGFFESISAFIIKRNPVELIGGLLTLSGIGGFKLYETCTKMGWNNFWHSWNRCRNCWIFHSCKR